MKSFYSILFIFLFFPDVSAQQILDGTWSFRAERDGSVTGYHEMTPRWNSDPFQQFRYHDETSDPDNGNHKMNFRLLFPNGYNESQKYPMIIFLHGLGEAAIRGSKANFPAYDLTNPKYLNNDHPLYHGGKAHLAAVNRDISHYRSFPGFVLFPQNKRSWNTESQNDVFTILNELIKKYNIDPNRIYLAGLSDGGNGVWVLMQRWPHLFAAALPISAVKRDLPVNKVVHIPIWHFQGEKDSYPRAAWARELHKKLRLAGGTPRYTEYPRAGHAIWNKAIAEEEYFSWMLGKNKTDIHVYHGDSLICEGDPINVRLGLSKGFKAYQWRKVIEGVETTFQPGTNNEITATEYGDYYVRISRVTVRSEDDWTAWSKNLKIREKEPTVAAEITALGSTTLPGLDNANSVGLTVPEGYETYVWFKDENLLEGANFSGNTITVGEAGSYTIIVTEPDGCESQPSAPMIVTLDAPTDHLIKPENLTADTESETKINLFWDDLETEELGYEVYRSTTAGSNYIFVAKTGKDAISFQDSGLKPGTTYYYIIRGVNDFGSSPPSNEASADTFGDSQAPTIPGNLVKTGSTDNTISLAWQPSMDNVGVHEYLIYINGELVGTTETTSLTVEELDVATEYKFTVKAIDMAGNISEASNEVTAVTIFEGLNYKYYQGVWEEVSGYEGSDVIKSGFIDNFNISHISEGGVRPDYQVDYFAFDFEGFLYIENAGNYEFKLRAASGSILYLDENVMVDNDGNHEASDKFSDPQYFEAGAHKVKVKYYDHVKEEVLEVSYKGPDTRGDFILIPDSALRSADFEYSAPPAAPTNLAAIAEGINQINLSWADVSTGNQYKIFRSLSAAGPFDIVHITAPGTASYQDKGLNGNTPYFYKVKATNQHGESEFALPASAVVPGVNYAYYEGSWDKLPYFSNLEVIKSGVVTDFNLNEKEENDDFAFKFDGLINIITAGEYVFYTESDDGSKLYINGQEVVDKDGLHGENEEESDIISLSVGLHPVTVTYFEKDRGQVLNVKYEGAGLTKAIIPADVLFLPVVTATTSADTDAPSTPTGLEVRGSSQSSISLSWTASTDNVGVVAYRISLYYLDPGQSTANARVSAMPDKVEFTNETSYTYPSLDANTTYYFTVAAMDAAGNSSEESLVVSGTTREASPLPVGFLHFSGEFVNGKVALSWATSGETNNDHFTIERSAGFDNFEPLATLDGAGNSTLVIEYTFTDAKPFNGLNYYRVRQTDYNGDQDYSRIIMVDCQLEGSALSAQVYPVPAKGNELYLAVKLLNQNNMVNLQVSDIYGQLIQVERFDPKQLQEPYNLFTHRAYRKGLYIILIEQAGAKVYKKFIIN